MRFDTLTSDEPVAAISIKSKEEVRRTLDQRRLINRGFLPNRLCLLFTITSAGATFVSWRLALIPIALLAADYAWFMLRRARVLRRFEAGRPRLNTAADLAAVSTAYRRAGVPEPSMSDYNEAAGFSAVPPWREELRYRIAASHYSGGTLADIGCGDGRLCWRYGACPPENYIGVDVSHNLLETLLARTEHRARAIASVAEQLPLADECVDALVCSECFEHLPRPEAALQEFNRVLKRGGVIAIQSPNALQPRNFNPFHILTLFLGYWWPAALLRNVIHSNTFVEAFTYHWDFTRQDFANYLGKCPGLRIKSMRGATYRFNPDGAAGHRILARLFRMPVLHWLGWDLTVVLIKA